MTRCALFLVLLLVACAGDGSAISEEDEEWLSSPFDNRVRGYLPRTGRPAASPVQE